MMIMHGSVEARKMRLRPQKPILKQDALAQYITIILAGQMFLQQP